MTQVDVIDDHFPPSSRRLVLSRLLYDHGADCFVADVGHSRAYPLRDRKLLQLTRDHTLEPRELAAARGVSSASVARDLQHVLTDAVGSGLAGALTVDVEHFRVLDHDMVLLCTNGLTDVVPLSRIEAVLDRRVTPDEHCQTLAEMARNAGAADDVPVLIARYRIPNVTASTQ